MTTGSMKDMVNKALDDSMKKKLVQNGPRLMKDMSAFKTMDSQGTFASTMEPGVGGAVTQVAEADKRKRRK